MRLNNAPPLSRSVLPHSRRALFKVWGGAAPRAAALPLAPRGDPQTAMSTGTAATAPADVMSERLEGDART